MKVCLGADEAARTYLIPCSSPTDSVGDLKRKALDRWLEDRGKKAGEWKADRLDLTLTENRALLSDTDPIQDVLKDGEFVDLCKSDVIFSTGYMFPW